MDDFTTDSSSTTSYDSMNGCFWNSQGQWDSTGALISLSRSDGGALQGTWSLIRAAQDITMALPSGGVWKFAGFCDDQGDHNWIKFYGDPAAGLPVLTLNNVDSRFVAKWICGRNFSESGVFPSGTAINYMLGVACG